MDTFVRRLLCGLFVVSAFAAPQLMAQIVVPTADLAVTKALTNPGTPTAGTDVPFTIVVTNNGSSAASSVTLNEQNTIGLTFVSASAPCSAFPCGLGNMAAGASITITVTYHIAPGAVTISNTAQVSSATSDPNPANNTATVTVRQVNVSADIQVTKNCTATANPGDTISCFVLVKNLGPSDSGVVTLDDPTPSGLTFVSTNNVSCPSFPCTVGNLGFGGTFGVTTTYQVAPTASGPITNTASVTSVSTDPVPGNDSASATIVVAANTDLSIAKTGPATASTGQTITYVVTVTNNGPATASGATVTDPTPSGLTLVSTTGACASYPCTLGSLAPGGTATITSTYTVDAGAPASVTNTATVNVTGGTDPVPGNNSASVTTSVTPSSDLSITKAGPATASTGQTITYVVTVTNNGPSTASGATVTDPTPSGLTLVSTTGACTSYPCTLGTLTAGGTATITSTYTVNAGAPPSVTNTATVNVTGGVDPVAGNNSASITTTVTPSSDLSITKKGPSSASPGQTITYVVTVTNNGPSTASGATVSDPTPTGLTLISTSGACTSYPCTLGALAPGGTATITSTYTVNSNAPASVTNSATVTLTSGVDPTAGNNTASITTTIVALADLAITKTGPAAVPSAGAMTFTINVKNNGPATVSAVTVSDTPSSNLSFVSASSPTVTCTSFPCTFGPMPAGVSVTINATYSVTGNPSQVTNTATVSSSTTSDPNTSNNTDSVTILGNTCPTGSPTIFIPFNGQPDVPTSGTMQWTNVGGTSYELFFGPAGSGCNSLVATVSGTNFQYSGLSANTDYEARVVAHRPGCPDVSSVCIKFRTGRPGGCNLNAPQLVSPKDGATAGSPVHLEWSNVGASLYHVVATQSGVTIADVTTSSTSTDVPIGNGPVSWSVTAINGNCTAQSPTGTFNVCGSAVAPLAGVVGAPSSGRVYSVLDTQPDPTIIRYDFQEATNDAFTDAQTRTTTASSVAYVHDAPVNAVVFFYRVRAFTSCSNEPGPWSRTLRVVIVPDIVDKRFINVPVGTKEPQTLQIFIPGEQDRVNFSATADRPWIIKIEPASGILPTEGITLKITIDPSHLPNGTFTATVIVTTSPITPSSSRIVTNGSNTKSVPVTINIVTPVVPMNSTSPTADSLIIPAVGHLFGINSQWRSDVRIYNASPQTLKYLLNFTPLGTTDVKRTTIETPSGETTALDDIIHNWYGVGEVGDSATGMLEIRPMTLDGSTTPPKGSNFFTVASSRTFNATIEGTVGQFIPPVKFTNLIGAGSKLSMQQIAQSAAYRTNFGLVEASGHPVNLVLSMFDSAGKKLFDLPVALAAGEQKLLAGLLAQQNVTVADGRMEVRVDGGDGKVTAYASVVDNASLDPQLVPGAKVTDTTSRLYVVPGVADLNNGLVSWRTDMRIYNAGSTTQTAELVFYPQDNAPIFATVQVNPGQVQTLDNIVQSLFSAHDEGGMVQITTATASSLIVTARTYNQTNTGTLGQFIRAATDKDAITAESGRSLNVLQVEDSPRFRTNIGLAEMSGKPVTVEVSVSLPDSKVTPSIQVPLAANEFRQFSVSQFGLGNIYNARVSVKVIDGFGSITAYGSVIDQVTTDPTYVQAQ